MTDCPIDCWLGSPVSPAELDWSEFYGALSREELATMRVQIADIGCGFGGLTGACYQRPGVLFVF